MKKLVQFNDVNIDKDDITYNIILDKLLNKRASEFVSIRDGIVPHKLIYNFKTEGEILKDFTNYEMPLELF